MKAAFRTAFIIFLLFQLTSCLEIYEKITFNKNGSGNASMILDLSKLKSTLDMIGRMGTPGNREIRVDDPIWSAKSDFQVKLTKLQGVEGLSGCRIVEDTTKALIGFEFDFADITALNKAMNIIAEIDSNSIEKTYFEFQKRQLIRTDASDFDALNISNESQKQDDPLNVIPLFEDMKYIMEYTFPKKVKEVTNKGATLSLDQKTVILEYQILGGPEVSSIANSIRF